MTETYTVEDVRYLVPEDLTGAQARGIEAYLNEGKIPPADPCLSCEPNLIRRYISRIQKAEAEGSWPPAGRIDGQLQSFGLPAVTSAQPSAQEPDEIYNVESLGEYTAAEPVEDRPASRTRKPKAE